MPMDVSGIPLPKCYTEKQCTVMYLLIDLFPNYCKCDVFIENFVFLRLLLLVRYSFFCAYINISIPFFKESKDFPTRLNKKGYTDKDNLYLITGYLYIL